MSESRLRFCGIGTTASERESAGVSNRVSGAAITSTKEAHMGAAKKKRKIKK